MEAGAHMERGSGATVMLVRPLDTQLWSLVNEASSWPGLLSVGSAHRAHGLGAVTEARWRAAGCEVQETGAEGSLKCCCTFRGEVILQVPAV